MRNINIKQLKSLINGLGHLPLRERIHLLTKIENIEIINKIFFECIKKVYPVWEQEYPNHQTMKDIIAKADALLYHQSGNTKEFEYYYNTYINYFQSIDGVVGLTGMTALSLCRNIAYSGITVESYEGEDDNAFDWQDWNPDFYASMAYSGGNPFIGEGDINRRKEFWIWYLEMVFQISQKPNKPVIDIKVEENIDKQFIRPARTQSYNTNIVKEKFEQIVSMTIEDLYEQEGEVDWNQIKINACCLKAGISIVTICYDTKGKKVEIKMTREWPEEKQSFILDDIKVNMYQQKPEEGAWFECELVIKQDKTYNIFFNYDDYDKLTDRAKNPQNLIREFETYPRSKEYTPEWWQNILGKKAKYLKE